MKQGYTFGASRFRLAWVALAYCILAVVVMGANPFKAETLAPMGLLDEYPGWDAHGFSSPPSHPERSDVLDVYLPQWIALKEAIRSGESGFWNPFPSNGHVGVLELSRGTLTPSFLVFAAIDEHWLGFYFAGLVKLMIAAVGAFLFLRLFIGTHAAFFGGAMFSLSGFNAAWFHWPHVATAAWIPWLLWACAGWYLSRRKHWLLYVVLSTVLLITGGFPAVAAYGLYSAALLAVVLTGFAGRNRGAMQAAVSLLFALVAGFLLAAIPLLALSEMLGLVNLDYRQGGTPFHFPQDLVLLVNPFVDGLPAVERTIHVGWVAFVLALSSLPLLWGRGQRNDASPLAWYGVILLGCSFAITFGLLPHDLLRSIPAVGSSSWGRVSLIVGLAFFILAAVAADRAIRLVQERGWWHYGAMAGLAMAAGYQLYGQAELFRAFNSVAMAADFFPATPTLDHVKKNLTETQSVVADEGYLIAGTLGAYGISEWFAHGFKTEAEKAVLVDLVEDPFRTPTSAMFPGSAIRLNGDLYARLGIRYVLMAHDKLKFIRRQPAIDPVSARLVPGNRLTQFTQTEVTLSLAAIGLVLDKQGEWHRHSQARLEISNAMGQLIAHATVRQEDIKGRGSPTLFRFEKPVVLSEGKYALNLSLPVGMSGESLAVLYSHKVRNTGDMMRINGQIVPAAMLYALYGRGEAVPFDARWWRTVGVDEDHIMALENRYAPGGAYWLSELSPAAPWSNADIVTGRMEAGRVSVRYSGSAAGYVILPVRFYPGWEASVNGSKAPLESYLGMLQAVRVNGPASIEFSYRPTYVRSGAVLMAGGALILVLLLSIAPSRGDARAGRQGKS